MDKFVQLGAALKGKAKLETLWDGTLYHIKDLPFSEDMHDMPDVFTPFRNKVRSQRIWLQVAMLSKLIGLAIAEN